MLQSVLYTLFHLILTLALESKGMLRKVICQRSYNQLALEQYNPGLLISKPEYPLKPLLMRTYIITASLERNWQYNVCKTTDPLSSPTSRNTLN